MKRMLALLLTLTLALGLLAGCGTTVVVAVPAPTPEAETPLCVRALPQASVMVNSVSHTLMYADAVDSVSRQSVDSSPVQLEQMNNDPTRIRNRRILGNFFILSSLL